MLTEMGSLIVKMTGTMAVLIVVALLIGGSEVLSDLTERKRSWKTAVGFGIMGGIFGIYGNLAGIDVNGAVVSIRDLGPMMAGFMGGPIGGLTAGLIAGAHRVFLGGITAQACIIATCLIGLICGILAVIFKEKIIQPMRAYFTATVMEAMHLGIVLLIVKPFSAAWEIVQQIALPFIFINAIGFGLLIMIMQTVEKHRRTEAERSRLKSELEVAMKIQQSLLPLITERFPGRDDIRLAANMKPAKEVGGDFYDFFYRDEDHMVILIADVSGKGIPAALFMANSKQTIQNCIREVPDLAEAISNANETLCENNEAEMFVTAWIGVLEISTGKIEYVCAGHNPPVLISEEETRFVKTRAGLVLAAMEGFRYQANSLELKKGEKLYLYTDGVTEAEDADHTLYGEERLQTCLEKACGLDVDETLKLVHEDIDRHVKDADQFDDMTMLCLELM